MRVHGSVPVPALVSVSVPVLVPVSVSDQTIWRTGDRGEPVPIPGFASAVFSKVTTRDAPAFWYPTTKG